MVWTNRIYNFSDSTFSCRSEISFSTKFNTSEASEPTKSWWWIFRSFFLFVPLALALNWTDKWIFIKHTPGPRLDARSSLVARFKTHLFPKTNRKHQRWITILFFACTRWLSFCIGKDPFVQHLQFSTSAESQLPYEKWPIRKVTAVPLPWHKERYLGDQVWGLRL